MNNETRYQTRAKTRKPNRHVNNIEKQHNQKISTTFINYQIYNYTGNNEFFTNDMKRLRDNLGETERGNYKRYILESNQNSLELMKYNNVMDQNKDNEQDWNCKEILEH